MTTPAHANSLVAGSCIRKRRLPVLGRDVVNADQNAMTMYRRFLTYAVSVLLLASFARAQPKPVRPLTEGDVKRAIPVLRVLAADGDETRDVQEAYDQAQRGYDAARSGSVDPVRTFREGGGERLLPPGFRVHEDCSRTLTQTWGRTTIVATAGFDNDAMARTWGGCGPGGKSSPELNKKVKQTDQTARAHLVKHGFAEQPPRFVGDRFTASVMPFTCLHASPGLGCAKLPSGPNIVFIDEALVGSLVQATKKSEAAKQERAARIARAAEAAGFTPQDFDDLHWALTLAQEDARNPALLDALAAMPEELRSAEAVRRKNLAVYRAFEGEVAPLLDAIAKKP